MEEKVINLLKQADSEGLLISGNDLNGYEFHGHDADVFTSQLKYILKYNQVNMNKIINMCLIGYTCI